MPIFLELVLLSLFTYAIGLGLGWLAWGRSATDSSAIEPHPEGDTAS